MVNLVSLGKSCQTTHQIRYFAEYNQQSVNVIKGPFDWLICPPDSTAAWLNEDLRDFQPNEIVEHRARAYWPYFKLWFWHGFIDRSTDQLELKITEQADIELSRLRYLREQFYALDLTTTQFILSNTQNNLDTEVYETDEGSHYRFDEKNIDSLQSALDAFFGRPAALHVITRPDRSTQGLLLRDNVHTLPSDLSNWKGDKIAWDNLLQELVSAV